jgi:gas vesicle protein
MKSGKQVITILAGAATAVITGILFAPYKGSTTRKKISKTSRKYADVVSDTYKSSVNGISNRLKSVKKEAEDEIKDAKKTVKAVKEVAKDVPKKIKKS